MIYLNKAILKPLSIFISVIFIPSIILITICCFLIKEIQVFIILCCFVLAYILAMCLTIKESRNKKYYLKVNNDSLEIAYPNLTRKDEVLSVRFIDIEKIDYYKITSFVSWLALIQMQCPKALFITYHINNRKEEKAIGHAELIDIVKICKEKEIKLIIH